MFATEIRNCAGSNVTLTLWSAKVCHHAKTEGKLLRADRCAKGQRARTHSIHVPTPSPTLGLTLQWTPLSATEDVWHILDVIPESPADIAGLLPYGDYIVGTPEGIVHGEAGLGELVEDYLARSLRLYVYNHEYAVTRLVTITPSRTWGGTGALGCVLGFGALHRLPVPLTEPPAGPGETLFETARFSNEESRPNSLNPRSSLETSESEEPQSHHPSNKFFIPATMKLPPPPPSATATAIATSPGHSRSSRKARHTGSSTLAIDDYFQEEEQKSREEDFAPAAKATPPPPPPKAGAPPPKPINPPQDIEIKEDDDA